jgi:hypothetical protein
MTTVWRVRQDAAERFLAELPQSTFSKPLEGAGWDVTFIKGDQDAKTLYLHEDTANLKPIAGILADCLAVDKSTPLAKKNLDGHTEAMGQSGELNKGRIEDFLKDAQAGDTSDSHREDLHSIWVPLDA